MQPCPCRFSAYRLTLFAVLAGYLPRLAEPLFAQTWMFQSMAGSDLRGPAPRLLDSADTAGNPAGQGW